MPRVEILTVEERKDLLFDVVACLDRESYGPSATRASLSLIQAIGQGNYFSQSKRTWQAGWFATNRPELYNQLTIFFHQHTPEDWNE